jgi:hypothetical protein
LPDTERTQVIGETRDGKYQRAGHQQQLVKRKLLTQVQGPREQREYHHEARPAALGRRHDMRAAVIGMVEPVAALGQREPQAGGQKGSGENQ